MKWDDAKEREQAELNRQIHAHSLSVVDVFQGMPGRVHEPVPPMTDAEWAVERERIQTFRAEFLASRGILDYEGTPAPGEEAAALREKHHVYGSKAWERDQDQMNAKLAEKRRQLRPGTFTRFWRQFVGPRKGEA